MNIYLNKIMVYHEIHRELRIPVAEKEPRILESYNHDTAPAARTRATKGQHPLSNPHVGKVQ